MNDYEVFLFLTEGFEETEAITTVDILRRADINVATVSITGGQYVTGSHNICVKADLLFEGSDLKNAKMLVLPGGPGHVKLGEHEELLLLIKEYHDEGKYLAAICAAPVIFGAMRILSGKKAVCFPSYEDKLIGAQISDDAAVVDGNIITSKGPGTATLFALKIVESLKGKDVMEKVRKSFILVNDDLQL